MPINNINFTPILMDLPEQLSELKEGSLLRKEDLDRIINAVIFSQMGVAASLQLSTKYYGLIDFEGRSALDLEVEGAYGKAAVRLKTITAITRGGLFIHYPEKYDDIEAEVDLSTSGSSSCLLLLVAYPFDRVGFGPATDNSPIRHRFGRFRFSFEYWEEDPSTKHTLFGPHQLPVARLVRQDGKWEVDYDYIPPLLRCSADEKAVAVLKKLERDCREICEECKRIIVRESNKYGSLEKSEHQLVRWISKAWKHLAFKMDEYSEWPEWAPYQLFQWLKELAMELRLELLLLPDHESTEMLRILEQWTSISPAAIRESIAKMSQQTFENHYLMKALENLSLFTDFLLEIFNAKLISPAGKNEKVAIPNHLKKINVWRSK